MVRARKFKQEEKPQKTCSTTENTKTLEIE
jgi:hypothetical protein